MNIGHFRKQDTQILKEAAEKLGLTLTESEPNPKFQQLKTEHVRVSIHGSDGDLSAFWRQVEQGGQS